MEISETQPLEEATPVVPETAATSEQREEHPQSRTRADRPGPDAPSTDGTGDEPSEDHYPPAPTGSAGHP